MAQIGTLKFSRRRYSTAVKALNQMIASAQTGTARRLRAVELLLSLYERHDRAEERRERDAARKAAGLPPEQPIDLDTEPDAPVDATEAARAFLERVHAKQEVTDVQ